MKRFTLSYVIAIITLIGTLIGAIVLHLNELTDQYVTQMILALLIFFALFFVEKNYDLAEKIDDLEKNTQDINDFLTGSIKYKIITGSENTFNLINTFLHKDCILNVTNFSDAILLKNISGKEVLTYLKNIEKYSYMDKNQFSFTRLIDSRPIMH